MKKILLSILGIFFGLSAFCSADTYQVSGSLYENTWLTSNRHRAVYSLSGDGSFQLTGFGIVYRTNYPFTLSDLNISGYTFNNLTSFVVPYPGNSNLSVLVVSFDGIFLNSDPLIFELRPFSSKQLEFTENFNFSSFPFNVIMLYNNTSNSGNPISPISFFYGGVSSSVFTVNYGNQSKEYTITDDVDIYINSPVVKIGSTFTYDGSTGINLVYNGQYNRYTKNKLYLDGQFRYRQGVFTPICL